MKKICSLKATALLAAGLLLAGRVYAQINYLSDNRSVSVSGHSLYVDSSTDPSTVYSNGYSYFQTPASPYSDFHGSVGGGLSGGLYIGNVISSASQDSGMTPNQIQVSSGIFVYSGFFSGNGQYGDALSSFAVAFSVSSPLEYTLSTDWSYSYYWGDYWVPNSGGCTLVSASQGLIWQSLPLQPSWDDSEDSRLDSFSGVLEPGDIYTLSVSMATDSAYQDTPPTTGDYSADVALTTVPEPNSLVMLALGLPMLACLRRVRLDP